MIRIFLFKIAWGVARLLAYSGFLMFFVFAQANNTEPVCENCWSPNLLFDIENGGIEQTLIFISGYGYGLNNTSKVLAAKGQQNYFCNNGGIIDSQELVEILNEHLSGQVTAEQVSSVITFGLIKKYPCKK